MVDMNVFRVLADVSHTVSKFILIWAIHSNRSAEGVSLLTQLMYTIVFLARYTDLFWVRFSVSAWNFLLKILYITTSIYIMFLMLRVFARTREREKAWKLSAYIILGSVLSTPLAMLIFKEKEDMSLWYLVVHRFSLILEAFCILPQLILLRQTTVPTVIDSFYLVTLGSYRAFYILNWIWLGAHRQEVEYIKVVCGVIQTAFYIDFAWVYYSRQRVKLRGGGIVDADDLRKGFLVNRFVDHRTSIEDEESEPTLSADNTQPHESGSGRTVNRWGNRGISISADDTLAKGDRARLENHANHTKQPGKSSALPADEDAFLSDDEDEDAPILGATSNEVLNSGTEWRDDPNKP